MSESLLHEDAQAHFNLMPKYLEDNVSLCKAVVEYLNGSYPLEDPIASWLYTPVPVVLHLATVLLHGMFKHTYNPQSFLKAVVEHFNAVYIPEKTWLYSLVS